MDLASKCLLNLLIITTAFTSFGWIATFAPMVISFVNTFSNSGHLCVPTVLRTAGKLYAHESGIYGD